MSVTTTDQSAGSTTATGTTQGGAATATTAAKPVEDIVTRASQVPTVKQDQVHVKEEDIEFDRNQHEEFLSKVDPAVRQEIEKYKKSLFTGVNKKFQEAADLKKQAEAARRRPSVSELLKDPEFIQEAQAMIQQQQLAQNPEGSTLTNDEWSALSDQEKAQFIQMRQALNVQQNQINRMISTQEDEKLKSRYKNYDGTSVDQIQKDLISGRVNATREHLWKVLDYDDAVNRAYQLGLQDRNVNLSEKKGASSTENGFNFTQTEEVPAKAAGQSGVEYFKTLALRRMRQAQEKIGRV